jgi:hypothetical protein
MSGVNSIAPLPGGTPLVGAVGLSSTSPAIIVGSSSGTNSLTVALGNIGGVRTMNTQNGDLNIIMSDGMGIVESTGGNLLLHPYFPLTGTATSGTVVAQNLTGALAWAVGSGDISTVAYVPGALVIYSGTTYICLVAQPIGSAFPSATNPNWKSIGTGSGCEGITWNTNGFNTVNTSIGIVGQQVNPFNTASGTGGFTIFGADAYSFVNNFATLNQTGALLDPTNSTNFANVVMRTTYTGSFTYETLPNLPQIPNWLYILAYGIHPSVQSNFTSTPVVIATPRQLCVLESGTITRTSGTGNTPRNITPLNSGSTGLNVGFPNNYSSYPANGLGVFWNNPPAQTIAEITSTVLTSVNGFGTVSKSPCIGQCDLSSDNPQVGDVYRYEITLAWYIIN